MPAAILRCPTGRVDDITMSVVETRGDRVRLGIVAPKEVPVHRQEVYDAIHGKANAEPAPSTVVVNTKPADSSTGPAH